MLSRFVPCIAFAFSSASLATTLCVSTTAELQDALTAAAANGEDDVILLEPGLYTVDAPLTYETYEDFDLSVSGGWEGCVAHHNDPRYTVIDGQSAHALVRFMGMPGTAGDVSVGWITFQNGVGEDGTNAVAMTPYAGWAGTLLVEGNVFRNLQGRADSGYTAIQLDSDLGRLEVRNNLFVDNTTETGISPVYLLANSTDFSYVGRFTNNTVTSNESTSYAVTADGGGIWSVANNVFWDNEGSDLGLGPYVFVTNNDIGSYCCNPVAESGNLSLDPGFVDPGGGDYRPGGSSPLAEAGRNDAPGGLGTYDLRGGFRVVGSTVDIGAYERQDRIFGDGFDSL
jgi:hypothetical protein